MNRNQFTVHSSILTGKPKVSMVSAWYNRPAQIRDTIAGMLGQDVDGLEIIVVNDGSPAADVRDLLDSYSDPRLTVIHQENQGFVRTIRRAIEMSRAPYVAIQGAGDVSYPDRLSRQLAVLEENPELAAISCGCVFRVVDADTAEEPKTVIPKARLHTREEFLTTGNPMIHGASTIRRASYDRVGGYREFFRYAQDRDLWLRLIEQYQIGSIPDILYEFRSFLKDGVSGSFTKSIDQIAYSRLADFSAAERASGRADPLANGGTLPLVLAPRDEKTLRRVFFHVNRLSDAGNLSAEDLLHVRRRFGWRIFLRAVVQCLRRGGLSAGLPWKLAVEALRHEVRGPR